MTHRPGSRPRSVLGFGGLLVLALLGTAPRVSAFPAAERDLAFQLIDRLNVDRASYGRAPLVADPLLDALADPRAERMAVTGLLSHEVGGDLASAIAGTGVRWFKVAENIGRTDAAWGEDSVDWLYRHWRGSAEHWQIMLDDSLNYVGVGLALSADGSTYASMVFAETADRTSPTAAMTSARLDDRTATFEWSGTEVALPTHTAGLLGFDVQCRVDAGPWRWIRVGTTTTSIELRNRTAGHGYSVRVRARDRAGNTSNWSVPLRVFIR